jgi:hypothetical protein
LAPPLWSLVVSIAGAIVTMAGATIAAMEAAEP